MKSNTLIGTLAVALLATAAQAFPPRMHMARGTLAAVDQKTQTIVLNVCCDKHEFALRDWTRIRIDGRKLALEKIALGTPVKVSYRHEAGLQSLYEIRSTDAGITRSPCVACVR